MVCYLKIILIDFLIISVLDISHIVQFVSRNETDVDYRKTQISIVSQLFYYPSHKHNFNIKIFVFFADLSPKAIVP